MNKFFPAIAMVMLAVSVQAATYYLQADMPVNSTPLDKTLWFDAPSGGTDMNSLGVPFAGNRFDVNGKQLRAPITAGSSTFDGTFAVGSAFCMLLTGMCSGWTLIISCSCVRINLPSRLCLLICRWDPPVI